MTAPKRGVVLQTLAPILLGIAFIVLLLITLQRCM